MLLSLVQELPANWTAEMGNSSVIELVLSNNSLTKISNKSLASLPASLRLLALDGNQLNELSLEALTVLDSRLTTADLRNLAVSSPSSALIFLQTVFFPPSPQLFSVKLSADL